MQRYVCADVLAAGVAGPHHQLLPRRAAAGQRQRGHEDRHRSRGQHGGGGRDTGRQVRHGPDRRRRVRYVLDVLMSYNPLLRPAQARTDFTAVPLTNCIRAWCAAQPSRSPGTRADTCWPTPATTRINTTETETRAVSRYWVLRYSVLPTLYTIY